MVEWDENYWTVLSPFDRVASIGEEVARTVVNGKPARIVTTTIDANSIAEQIIAGVTLLAIGAAGAHAYDVWKTNRG